MNVRRTLCVAVALRSPSFRWKLRQLWVRDESISGIRNSIAMWSSLLYKFCWNGKGHGNGMAGTGGNENTIHFPISTPEQASRHIRSAYTIGRKTGIGEKWPNLDICICNLMFSYFWYTRRLQFLASLLVTCFITSMKNNRNRCDEILIY